MVLFARGCAAAAAGDPRAAAHLEACGRARTAWGEHNPASAPWRSQLALVLAALSRSEEASQLADEELRLALRFGADRATGIALRACALLRSGHEQVQGLREAAQTLAVTPAKLEHARALLDLGAALRRTGHRSEAREVLAEALDGCQACGAHELATRARAELKTAGARPRRDRLRGPDALTASNSLYGGVGNDMLDPGTGVGSLLDGAAGDDLLRRACCSSETAASMSGGAGFDIADYGSLLPTDVNAPISVSLDAVANDGAPASHDNVAPDVENLIGGRGSDTLIGDGDDNVLDGGCGTDTLIGGSGTDTSDYSTRAQAVSISLDGVANDGQQFQPEIGSAMPESDNVASDIEIVAAGSGNDVLVGAAAANRLDGGAGDDVLRGGAGPDMLGGGAGTDTADYSDHSAGVQATADGTPTSGNGEDGPAGTRDTVADDVEGLLGGPGPDALTGSAVANRLDGAGGGDTLNGLAGDDALRGGDGDDVLNGGAGFDAADYSDRTTEVVVALDGEQNDGGAGENDNVGPDGDIENALGGSGDDLLVGDDGANRLEGAAGHDLLDGDAGPDTLAGGDGYDVAAYLDRADPLRLMIDGSPGSGGALDGPPGARDVIDHDIEGLWAGAANDRLTGDADDNNLYGGNGADVLIGGDGSDAADYSDRTLGVTVTPDGRPDSGNAADGPASARDTVSSDVEAIFGGAGDDQLTGSPSSNYIDAGAGDDLINSRDMGADADICGDGSDTAVVDDDDFFDTSCETVDAPQAPPPPSGSTGIGPRPTTTPSPLDTTPPNTSLRLATRQSASRALKRGLTVRVACSETCTLDAKLLLDGRTAQALGFVKRRRSVAVAAGHAREAGTIVLRFSAKARRRLAHVKRIKLTLVLRATDPSGNRATLRRTLTLTVSGAARRRTTTTAAPRPSRRAVEHVCLPYHSVTMTEPLHSTTSAAPAQPVQRAASWWACR